jgi:hypothetical protein
MTVKTYKSLITDKYIELQNVLQLNFSDKVAILLPNINDVDITDIVYYFSVIFMDNTVESVLKNFVKQHSIDISQAEFDKLVTIVKPFVTWLLNLR